MLNTIQNQLNYLEKKLNGQKKVNAHKMWYWITDNKPLKNTKGSGTYTDVRVAGHPKQVIFFLDNNGNEYQLVFEMDCHTEVLSNPYQQIVKH